MIIKTPYEEIFLSHNFGKWLGNNRIVASEVQVIQDGNIIPNMVQNVAPYNVNKVRYKLLGGESGNYVIRVLIQTEDGQKFEDKIDLCITNT